MDFMPWHSSQTEKIFEETDSKEDGLTDEEAQQRLESDGENIIESGEDVSPLKILFDQFNDFLIYLLIAAALVSLGVGLLDGHSPEWVDATLIFLILIANGIFGFVQDYKAEKSIKALKDLSTPDATVLRDGEKKQIDSRNVVPGDLIYVEQGDSIPADARLIDSHSLETDEAALTGESSNVSKHEGVLEEDTPLAERKNMLFKNTTVVKGRGKAIIVETGMGTQVGDIAEQIESAEDRETPFQREVDKLGKKIGYGIIGIIGIVAAIQTFMSTGGLEHISATSMVPVIMVAITLAVAAVPEGLPAVVTLTLALGSKKMLKKDALVRRLPVVESLGSVDYIVTDKTGTLTEGVMTVKKVLYSGEVFDVTGTGYELEGKFKKDGHVTDTGYLEPILECSYYCNNAEKAPEEEKEKFYGDPTEIALLVSAMKGGINGGKKRVREIPFSSDRKRMTVITEDSRAYMKGAPGRILERCDRILVDGEVKKLSEDKKEEIRHVNHNFAEEALRVLGFAYKKNVDSENASDQEVEREMIFLGLQGMIDPPREEVREAVEDCRSAGINTVMATGDNIETARAIGDDIGFDPEKAVTGNDVSALTDGELEEEVENTEIFARVSPEDKVEILQGLQRNGHNVAMTGDGVNDAPALKNSDVGIAMGERGTDVAKQSSDMILQDDNFVTIRDAIAEGRGIFDNIRKFVNYLLSANVGEVLIVFLGILIGSLLFPETFTSNSEALILTPVMLLWINFVTDGLPALALGADPKSENIMEREPRGKEEPVISKRMMFSIGSIGLLISIVGLPLFFRGLQESLMLGQTLLFTFMVVIEMARIQTIRKRYNLGIFSNKWLTGAIGASLLLQLTVLYTPLSEYFKTANPGIAGWIGIIAATGLFYSGSMITENLLERFFTG